jgi:glycosyltransferase involved in cell wall biosynthesis
MTEEYLISVIVPVYQVEQYLDECVQSILQQTYRNLELILVDDGSPDGCGRMCDEYQRQDDRVRVLHKENGGLSDARNAGIDMAQGDYLTFVDSDDYVRNDYLSLLLTSVRENGADIVQGKFTQIPEELGKQPDGTPVVFTGEEAFRQLLLMKKVDVMAQNKLYKRSLFRTIRYPYGYINEDNRTTYKLLFGAGKVVCIPDVIYFYRINMQGIMQSPFSEKRLEILSVPDEIRAYLGDRAPAYHDEIEYHEMRICMRIYHDILTITDSTEYADEAKRIRERLLGLNRKNPYFERKYRLLLALQSRSPSLYRQLVKRFRK